MLCFLFRAIYGYNKDTNDLEVVTTGKELGELVDELDSCKILYAFARVVDPNTGLNKYVQINWVSHLVENLYLGFFLDTFKRMYITFSYD